MQSEAPFALSPMCFPSAASPTWVQWLQHHESGQSIRFPIPRLPPNRERTHVDSCNMVNATLFIFADAYPSRSVHFKSGAFGRATPGGQRWNCPLLETEYAFLPGVHKPLTSSLSQIQPVINGVACWIPDCETIFSNTFLTSCALLSSNQRLKVSVFPSASRHAKAIMLTQSS